MVVDGREDVDLGKDEQVRDGRSIAFNSHDQPLTDPNVDHNTSLYQEQASLLLSLSGIRAINSQGIPGLPGSGNIQAQESFQGPWDTDGVAHMYDPDPALVRYDNADDLSVLWEGADGFDGTFTPTWI
jgi:hypothetical protein